MNYSVSETILQACPQYVAAVLEAEVKNTATPADLWQEIEAATAEVRRIHTPDTLKDLASIAATRVAYRQLGKDPSRYRPSGEALMRRVLQGKPLYRIDALVDLVNLASLRSGYSIGGFDRDRIDGDTLTLGVGREGEPYEGIGRGALNIAGMPVWRDATGGVGTPTSDNERTRITAGTRRLLVIVNGYDGNAAGVTATAEFISRLLRHYVGAGDPVDLRLIRGNEAKSRP